MSILAPKSDRTRTHTEPLFDAAPAVTAPAERHWFVADEGGSYCAACALPRNSRRHVERAA